MSRANIITKGLLLTTVAQTLLETDSNQQSKPHILSLVFCNITGTNQTVDVSIVKQGTGGGTWSIAKNWTIPANTGPVQLDNQGAPLFELSYSGSDLDKITVTASANSSIHCLVTYIKGSEVRVT